MLHECVGAPGLEVGTELAGVALCAAKLSEVFGGDGGSEEEEGLGGAEVASVDADGEQCGSRVVGVGDEVGAVVAVVGGVRLWRLALFRSLWWSLS